MRAATSPAIKQAMHIPHRARPPAVAPGARRGRVGAIALAALAGLAGCAGYGTDGLQRGDSAEQVRQRMGAPTGQYALADGATRLEYARGPYGKHTYMVDLDRAGRVTGFEQVLTEPNFDRVAVSAGLSTDELLRRLGRPSDVRSGGWQGGQVWSYRYQATFCQWFQVGVANGRVRDAAYGPDPLCDADDRGDRD